MYTFDEVWLSRYPIPEYIGFDNGGEYKNVFEELVNNYGMKKKNSTPFNPQYNRIIERVRVMLNDVLRTVEIDGRDDRHLNSVITCSVKVCNDNYELNN
jgi:hypothetical protein